jgi:hypothetical protein
MSVVHLAPDGSFAVLGSGQPADIVIDLVGAFTTSGTSKYVALASPVRMADTRSGNGGRLGSLQTGTDMSLYAGGLYGIPSTASAIFSTLIAVPANAGVLAVFPDTAQNRATAPGVSTVNFTTGRIVGNATIANMNTTNGSTIIYNLIGTVDAVMDVFGYFT